jgi:hypothetical protein
MAGDIRDIAKVPEDRIGFVLMLFSADCPDASKGQNPGAPDLPDLTLLPYSKQSKIKKEHVSRAEIRTVPSRDVALGYPLVMH